MKRWRAAAVLAILATLSACASRPPEAGATASQAAPSPDRPFSFGTGDGLSIATAVVVNARFEDEGVAAERVWINEHYPGASKDSQALLNGKKGRAYDAIGITTSDGKRLTVYFDITPFFGKY